MVSITDLPLMVALVQSAATLPMMMFELMAGACADLFDRKIQMVASLTFWALAATLLCSLIYTNTLSPGSLLLFTFLIGLGTSFFTSAGRPAS
jgi:MFS family permease